MIRVKQNFKFTLAYLSPYSDYLNNVRSKNNYQISNMFNDTKQTCLSLILLTHISIDGVFPLFPLFKNHYSFYSHMQITIDVLINNLFL